MTIVPLNCLGCSQPSCIACRIRLAGGVGLIEGKVHYTLNGEIPLRDCRQCEHYDDSLMSIAEVKRRELPIREWHECEAGEPPVCLCEPQRRCSKFQARGEA